MTPSSITQRLQGIEDKLKPKLLHRQGRTITLTDEGQLLAERACLILAGLDGLQECLQDRKHELVGRLRILAPLGFGSEYVAKLAAWDIVIHIGALPDSSMLQTVLAKNRRFL